MSNNKSINNRKDKNDKKGSGVRTRVRARQQVPVACGVAAQVSMPRISQGRYTDSVKIKRKEFVGSFTNGASTGFSVVPLCTSIPGYDINPGCALLFPWLANLASSFERFRFNSLKMHVIPSQATTTAGRYYCAIDYDYDDVVPSNKVAIMGNRSAVESPVWQELELTAVPSELHRDMPTKYVSLQSRNNFTEARTAYCGFVIFAIDTPTANLLFDVWVEYDVDLISPVNDSVVIQDAWTNYTASTLSTTTSAVGTAFGGCNNFAATSVPGPLKILVPGSAGVPSVSIPLGGASFTSNLMKLIDIGPAGGNGKLDVLFQNIVTGATPSAAIGTSGFNIGLQAFDSSGASLGDSLALSPVGATRAVGVKDVSSSMLTAGASVWSQATMYLSSLLTALPTARYLAPFVYSTAALGAGSSLVGFKFEL